MNEERCEDCGVNDAVIRLTQVVNNEMTVVQLCESCAAARGVESGGDVSTPLSDFIAHVGGSAPSQVAQQLRCSFCGLTYGDFKKVGRLGCPECWTTFQASLEPLVRRIHGAVQHVGKVYLPPDPSASERQKRLEGLRHRLHRAVQAEDFERAAEIRDRIRDLEPDEVR
ncbi:MAG: UvrB/UvrC motif-containing protein [Gemmatimonadota bacterium]|jgi:protein arginine kinase activator